MSESINEVRLSGHLGSDPEMRYIASGTALTTFSVAVTEYRPDGSANASGQRTLVERTHWIRVTTWAQLAEELGPRLRKGDLVEVEARLESRSWDVTDQAGQPVYRADGRVEKRYDLGIVARRVRHEGAWIDGRRAGSRAAPPAQRGPDPRYESGYAPGAGPARGVPADPPGASDADDLPFE
ncbi:MAG: single-stranded DNA-binding protein [Dehalococcoidia bacterium]